MLAFWLSLLVCTTVVCIAIYWGTKYYGLPERTVLFTSFYVVVSGGGAGMLFNGITELLFPSLRDRLGRGQFVILCLAVGAVMGAFLGLKEIDETSLWRLLGFPAAVSAMTALVCSLVYRLYRLRYEILVHSYTHWLRAVVHDADPNAVVSVTEGVAWEHIWASGLIGGGDYQKTSNYLQTRVGKTVIEGCNVQIRASEKSSDGETYYREVFNGMLIRVTLSEGFDGAVMLQPLRSADDGSADWLTALGQQIFQPLASLLKSFFGGSPPQRIIFEDAKFDRALAVTSENVELSHRVLPYSFRRRILALPKAVGWMPTMSFVGGSMYLAKGQVRFEFGDPERLLRPGTFLPNYFTRIGKQTVWGVKLYHHVGRTLFPM